MMQKIVEKVYISSADEVHRILAQDGLTLKTMEMN